MAGVWVPFLVCAFTLMTAPSSASAAFRGDVYAEQAYQSRIQQSATSLRVRNEFVQWKNLSAYATLGAELQNYQDGQWSGPGDSYLYAAPGVRAEVGKVLLFAETRLRYYPDPKSRERATDLRGLAVYGKFFEGPGIGVFRTFGELYTEGTVTSADRWNAIANVFVRAGLRYPLGAAAYADIFLEPFVSLDRVRHYYNNRADLKLTFRLQGIVGGLQLGIQTSLVANTYFTRGNFEPNPFRTRNMGFRVLGVLGGLW